MRRRTSICRGVLIVFLFIRVGWIHANQYPGYAYLSPVPGSSCHNPETSILIRTAEELDTALCGLDVFYLLGERSGLHRGRIQVLGDKKTLVFQPDEPFLLSENVTVYGPRPLITLGGDTLAGLEYRFSIRETSQYEDFENPSLNAENNKDFALKSLETPSMVVSNSSRPAPGHIFTALKTGGLGHLIAFDTEGTPVFHRQFSHYVENFQPWPDGRISYFDFAARTYFLLDKQQRIVDTIRMKNGYKADFHNFLRLASGHTILMCNDLQTIDMSLIVDGGYTNATLSGLVIQELDENGDLVFQWRSWDHFRITDSYADLTVQSIDHLHPNSMFADSGNTLIISCRNTSEITKISRTDGSIIWRMGGKNNEFTRIGDPKGFTGQHAVTRLENGNLLLFDNSIDLETDPWLVKPVEPSKSGQSIHSDVNSRGLEYILSESGKTISLHREFRHSPQYQTSRMGYIQRIDNGNTLINWGSSYTLPGMDITEYDTEGRVVFEAGLEDITADFYKIYKHPFHTELFSLMDDSLQFDNVFVGESAAADLAIRNTGNQDIQITSILHDHPAYSIDAVLPILINPGMAHTLQVRFHPVEAGVQHEVLTICSDTDSSRIAQQIILKGTGKFHVSVKDFHDSDISLFPNPSDGRLVIGNLEPGDRIRVCNLPGQVVYEHIAWERRLQIDVSSLARGAYSIRVTGTRGHVRTSRFIRQ